MRSKLYAPHIILVLLYYFFHIKGTKQSAKVKLDIALCFDTCTDHVLQVNNLSWTVSVSVWHQ